MEEVSKNLIAIRKRDVSKANEAFADLMSLTEKCLNDKVKLDHTLYKKCSGVKMEPVALEALREVAPQTPFRPEEIQLVSGAKFPDIQAEKYYGVEVKTTSSNSWKSVGSSIVESTRIEDVSMIQVVKRLYDLKDDILSLLKHPDEALVDDIGEMWTLECSPKYYVDCWMNMMQHVFGENDALKGIKIKDIFEKY